MKKLFYLFNLFFLLTSVSFAQGEDQEGCKDLPMFNRMPNFHITSCISKEFDAYKFSIENSTAEDCKKQTIEGKYYEYSYAINEGAKEVSALQIFRNFENAIIKEKADIIAKVVESGNAYSFITAKISQNNMETWVCIQTSGLDYQLFVIEKQVMEQVIKANAMLEALNKEGFIALNILFDINKSGIKPESQPLIEEIYTLMRDNATLKIKIEGHTDNTGTQADNKILSEARAKAVVDVLLKKGITKDRLSSAGWGQEKPVADNRTEEGRTKNRRVEIIKQ